jgi:hypothetical protein
MHAEISAHSTYLSAFHTSAAGLRIMHKAPTCYNTSRDGLAAVWPRICCDSNRRADGVCVLCLVRVATCKY